MRIRSVKFNFIMNFILTASAIIFPLITFPYISRILLVDGNGKVAFASSVLTYFTMFASLGIPTYGIRACAKVRDDKAKLSKTVQELLILNAVTMVIVYGVFVLTLFAVPQFAAEKELLLINSICMVLNVFGVTWLYSALEQYAYITICSIAFKGISIIMMFALVKKPEDYIVYGAITVFAASGSYVMNFLSLKRFVTLRKSGSYDFRKHMRPILVFFAMSAAISVYTNLDIVMLGFMKGNVEVGYYNAAIKVKTILVSLITSLGTVLLPRLSYYIEKQEQEAFNKTIAKAFNFVLLLATSVTVYFIIFAKESIHLLASGAFSGAVLPMALLMPTVLFIGLSNVTGIQILTPRGKEKTVLHSIAAGALVDFGLNFLLIPRYGAAGAAFATVVAELVVLVVQCLYLKEMLRDVISKLNIQKIVIALCGSSGLMVLVKGMNLESVFLTLCISAVGYYGCFGGLLLLQKETMTVEVVKGVLGLVRGRKDIS